MPAAPVPSSTATPPLQSIECMEILGGNHADCRRVAVPGMDAWLVSEPHAGQHQGGDIHYISTCAGARISRFAVADVAGHGEAVAQLAQRLRQLMRKHINRVNQTRFARRLNTEFTAAAADESFATAVLATYFNPTNHLIVCNAGHPPPLWYRSAARTWEPLSHDSPRTVPRVSNLPLGVIEPTHYFQFAVELAVGDVVLVYTDALPEARDPAGRLLGQQGLLDLVQQLDAGELDALGRQLLERLAAYRGGTPADDDLTLLLLQRNGHRWPHHSLRDMVRVVGKMMGLVRV